MSLLLTHHRPSRAALAATVLALLSGLVGCVHTLQPPAPAAAVPVPAQWSAAPAEAADATAPATALSGWWRAFNDPQLTGLIDQALQANTSVRGAQAALQQARALRDVAAANRG
ncbi:MAG TPA: TolC family protein, partial [Macromonas sp.]|nr:TolC family protein [Macromonas sp.]